MKKYIMLIGLLMLAGCTQTPYTTQNQTPPPAPQTPSQTITTVYELPQSDIEELKTVFEQKHASEATEGSPVQINMTLEKQAEGFARGTIIVGDPTAGTPGYLFLAAKKDGKWEVVFSGNGQIVCEEVAPYNFPSEMIADCVSNAGQTEVSPQEIPAQE